jgi:arylsulfatase A-like enzyme
MVRLVDVTPTIRDLLGLPVGPDVDGASLLPALLGDTPPSDARFARGHPSDSAPGAP